MGWGLERIESEGWIRFFLSSPPEGTKRIGLTSLAFTPVTPVVVLDHHATRITGDRTGGQSEKTGGIFLIGLDDVSGSLVEDGWRTTRGLADG